MRTIYVDSEHKCHVTDDGNMTAVETAHFDGFCDTYVEGFCYDDSKGYVAMYVWKDFSLLSAAQAQYEADLAAMEAAYREGVNSV